MISGLLLQIILPLDIQLLHPACPACPFPLTELRLMRTLQQQPASVKT